VPARHRSTDRTTPESRITPANTCRARDGAHVRPSLILERAALSHLGADAGLGVGVALSGTVRVFPRLREMLRYDAARATRAARTRHPRAAGRQEPDSRASSPGRKTTCGPRCSSTAMHHPRQVCPPAEAGKPRCSSADSDHYPPAARIPRVLADRAAPIARSFGGMKS